MNLALMNKEEEEEEVLIDVSELPGSLLVSFDIA